MDESFLTTGDASRRLGISPEYLRKLADSGRLRVERTTKGQRIFRASDLEDYEANREEKKKGAQVAGA